MTAPAAPGRPQWSAVSDAALADDQLPRVAAALGFDRSEGPVARGDVPGFAPEYHRFRFLKSRLAMGVTVQAQGYRSGAFDAAALAALRRSDAIQRGRLAALNHHLRTRPCRLLIQDGPPPLGVLLCCETGEWQDHTGGARGDDLCSLGAFMWRIRYGQAAARLARLLGMPRIPVAA
jgi:hypothetical protein